MVKKPQPPKPDPDDTPKDEIDREEHITEIEFDRAGKLKLRMGEREFLSFMRGIVLVLIPALILAIVIGIIYMLMLLGFRVPQIGIVFGWVLYSSLCVWFFAPPH